MKFDLDKTMPDLLGANIPNPDKPDEPLTMRAAIRAAVVFQRRDGAPYSPTDALRRYDLAMGALAQPGPVELSADDIVLVNASTGNIWNPLVSGAIARQLEKPETSVTTGSDNESFTA